MPNYTDLRVSASIETANEYGLKSWSKLEIGAALLENETPEQAYAEIKNKIHSLLGNPNEVQVRQQQKENIGTDEDIYALMDKCKTVDELMSFKIIASQKEATRNFFDNKLNSPSIIRKQTTV